jgi:hypothetical protein
MTSSRIDASQYLRSDELDLLARHGVSISSMGLAFAKDLEESDLRTIWRAVAAVRRRSSNADWTNWLVGDWANETARRLGEGAESRIIREEESEFQYTQHLWRLAGATLYSLQLTELSIGLCCRCLAPDQIELAPDTVFDVNAAVRRKTLGQLSKLLKDRQIFIEAFKQRMDQFVERRNRFTHRLWVEPRPSDGLDHSSRMTILRGHERFILDLLAESHSIGKIFKGLFVAIGVSIAERDHVAMLGRELDEWAENLAEFDQVRRTAERTHSAPNLRLERTAKNDRGSR